MLRFLTAGESHGKALVSILEGMVSGLPLTEEYINSELKKRQAGLGRSVRQAMENDSVEILSGMRNGKTTGAPIALVISNVDNHERKEVMSQLRPGHADLAGILKYGLSDIRPVLERASARETASRVAVGAVARRFLEEFGVKISSKVISLGGSAHENEWEALVEKAKNDGDTLGGVFEVTAEGVPAGLGSHVHYDRKLDGQLALALMSMQAVKGVEVGIGFEAAARRGSQVHDEIGFRDGKYIRGSNRAGGIEGGISNGQPIVLKAAVKPISMMKKAMNSVDITTKEACQAHFERSDVCAVFPAAIVGESAAAVALAGAFLEKFGGDSLEEVRSHFNSSL